MSHTEHPVLHKKRFAIANRDLTARDRGGTVWRGGPHVRRINRTPPSHQRPTETRCHLSCTG